MHNRVCVCTSVRSDTDIRRDVNGRVFERDRPPRVNLSVYYNNIV